MDWESDQTSLSPLYAPSISPSEATFDFGFGKPAPKYPWTSQETIAGSTWSMAESQNGTDLAVDHERRRDTDLETGDRFLTTRSYTASLGSSGSVMAGEVLALMAPSGSGKSTLLNVLVKRSRLPHTGSVCVNGTQATSNRIRALSRYVEQQDIHLGGLTVFENVLFTARLAAGMKSGSICRSRCLDVLHTLGLGGQKDMLVSPLLKVGISGGQRRRLSLATTLVTGPKILFLDEPTSGLDSVASHQVIKFLRDIARRHKLLTVASIHQPSTATFNLFDKVMLISRGRTCYFGPRCGGW